MPGRLRALLRQADHQNRQTGPRKQPQNRPQPPVKRQNLPVIRSPRAPQPDHDTQRRNTAIPPTCDRQADHVMPCQEPRKRAPQPARKARSGMFAVPPHRLLPLVDAASLRQNP